MPKVPITFHIFPVTTQVFHLTKHTFAIVNLKPIVSGHVLVIPIRKVSRISQLPAIESADFFATVQRVSKFINHIYSADALNIGIQDGIGAGQSVPHVHCHLIPRYLKDGWGDGIYEALEFEEGMLRNEWWKEVCKPMGLVDGRSERSMSDMEKEAEWLRIEMDKWLENGGDDEVVVEGEEGGDDDDDSINKI